MFFLLENLDEAVFNSVFWIVQKLKPYEWIRLISDIWGIVGCKGAVSDPLFLCHCQLKVGKMGLILSLVGKEEIASGIWVENTHNLDIDCME